MEYDSVVRELRNLEQGLSNENIGEIESVLDRLNEEYDAIRLEELSNLARLESTQAELDLDTEEHETLNRYRRSLMSSFFGRGGLLSACELLILDPDSNDFSELQTRTSELIDREDALDERTPSIVNIISESTLPPRIGILDFVSQTESPIIGDTVELKLVIENVGNRVASDIVVSLTAEKFGFETSQSFDQLSPEERREITFEVEATFDEAATVEVSVGSSDTGRTRDRTTINIRTKESIVQTAIQMLEEINERLNNSRTNQRNIRPISSKIDSALRSLERALSEIDRGRNKQTNNAINTATNQLGALLNSLDRETYNNIPDNLVIAVNNTTELVIDNLSDARRADIE